MMSPHALDDLLHSCHHGDQMQMAMTSQSLSAVSLQEPITCCSCGELVSDCFFLLAAGQPWHNTCLRCSACHCELQTHASLFWRDSAIYCQHDYYRLFGGGSCARCLQPIPASDLVMQSGDLTFHQHCFSCQECKVRLEPGSLYSVQGHSLFCQLHCSSTLPLSPEELSYTENHTAGDGQTFTEGEESESSSDYRLVDSSSEGRVHRRAKRIRTCFRSEQIQALESYFDQKQNPEGKDWSKLSHQTGLSKRVLQVWFQNARAKLRRSLTLDDPQVSPASSAHPRPVFMTTSGSTAPSLSFAASTIDQSQLSLLIAPLSPAPGPDYDSHDAPGMSLHAAKDACHPRVSF